MVTSYSEARGFLFWFHDRFGFYVKKMITPYNYMQYVNRCSEQAVIINNYIQLIFADNYLIIS